MFSRRHRNPGLSISLTSEQTNDVTKSGLLVLSLRLDCKLRYIQHIEIKMKVLERNVAFLISMANRFTCPTRRLLIRILRVWFLRKLNNAVAVWIGLPEKYKLDNDAWFVFTDSSVYDGDDLYVCKGKFGGTGIYIISPTNYDTHDPNLVVRKGFPVGVNQTIRSCELTAIDYLLRCFKNSPTLIKQKLHIISDSQYCVNLSGGLARDVKHEKIFHIIMFSYRAIVLAGDKVDINWVSDHIDNFGNYRADCFVKAGAKYAYKARNNKKKLEGLAYGTPFSAIRRKIHDVVTRQWLLGWKYDRRSRSYYNLQPMTTFTKCWHSGVGSRTVIVSRIWLHLGHSPLNAHRHKHNNTISSECMCKCGAETTHHFLYVCNRYVIPRRTLREDLMKLFGVYAETTGLLLAYADKSNDMDIMKIGLLDEYTTTTKRFTRAPYDIYDAPTVPSTTPATTTNYPSPVPTTCSPPTAPSPP